MNFDQILGRMATALLEAPSVQVVVVVAVTSETGQDGQIRTAITALSQAQGAAIPQLLRDVAARIDRDGIGPGMDLGQKES